MAVFVAISINLGITLLHVTFHFYGAWWARFVDGPNDRLTRCQRPATVVVAPLEALPRGPGFDPPRGRISALGLKKLSRLSHVQSTVESGLTHKATAPRVRMGQGFGGFLGLL